jgi:hypothetical protein
LKQRVVGNERQHNEGADLFASVLIKLTDLPMITLMMAGPTTPDSMSALARLLAGALESKAKATTTSALGSGRSCLEHDSLAPSYAIFKRRVWLRLIRFLLLHIFLPGARSLIWLGI